MTTTKMTPELAAFIRAMPKVELHVHLEGAIRPETLLQLSRRNNVPLPYDNVEDLRQWYVFRDFPHFVEIYVKLSSCIRTADDLELIAREFLEGQADQNIRYSEPTYTAYTIFQHCGISFDDQFAALNRARRWAEQTLGVSMNLIVDIAREVTPEIGMVTAEQVVKHYGNGVCALGLGGYELGHPPEKFQDAFALVNAAGIPCILHAGETGGADSIWSALRVANSRRIGHGVRCLDDESLVEYLREHQIPLEVSPTSNVCLNVAPSIAQHPIQTMLERGLYVTLNSDDPPMFNTTLTNEFIICAETFDWGKFLLEKLTMNAVRASLLSDADKAELERSIRADFARMLNKDVPAAL
ncbi:MAG: adenosine deaminase [Anaerolineae bacterium]|nr:adenosine deaminase [Anaerolineae bacterium]